MTTHAQILRNGKLWFTQDCDGYPDHTGKLILAVLKKHGKLQRRHLRLYFSGYTEDAGGEWQYDLRRDGVFYRVAPGTITIRMDSGSRLARASAKQEDREQQWRPLTPRVTGSLKDYEKFLRGCRYYHYTKDSPRSERALGLPPSKYLIGTTIKNLHGEVIGKVTAKHFSFGMGWDYDVGAMCNSEDYVVPA